MEAWKYGLLIGGTALLGTLFSIHGIEFLNDNDVVSDESTHALIRVIAPIGIMGGFCTAASIAGGVSSTLFPKGI
jgi:hypothetical protein